jgi:hypothetical protein
MASRVGDPSRDSVPVRVVRRSVVEIVVIVIVVDDRRMLDLVLLPPLLAALDALLDLLRLGTTRRVLLLLLDGEDVDAVSRRRRAGCDHRAREDDGAKGAHALVMAYVRAVRKRKILVKIVILLCVYIDFCAKMGHVKMSAVRFASSVAERVPMNRPEARYGRRELDVATEAFEARLVRQPLRDEMQELLDGTAARVAEVEPPALPTF